MDGGWLSGLNIIPAPFTNASNHSLGIQLPPFVDPDPQPQSCIPRFRPVPGPSPALLVLGLAKPDCRAHCESIVHRMKSKIWASKMGDGSTLR